MQKSEYRHTWPINASLDTLTQKLGEAEAKIVIFEVRAGSNLEHAMVSYERRNFRTMAHLLSDVHT